MTSIGSIPKQGPLEALTPKTNEGPEKLSGKDLEKKKLLESAKEFESIFYGMMLKSMRDSVEKSGFIDGGNAEKIYESMLDQEYAKVLADKQASGLAETLVKQLQGNIDKNPDLQRLQAERGKQVYDAAALQDSLKR